MRWFAGLALFLVAWGGMPQRGAAEVAAAATPGADQATAAEESLWDAVDISFRNLTFGQAQKPVDSPLNEDNRLGLNRYTLESDFRLDLKAQFSRLDLIFKPRWDFFSQRWEDGARDSDSDCDEEAYVNEWLVRVQPIDNVFLSYGRENLQWGPSFLLSPSNPFYTDNGRNRPKKEVAGADYARVVWTPNEKWTTSFIANTDEGLKGDIEDDYPGINPDDTVKTVLNMLEKDFEETYAFKVDYVADQGYFSLILSTRHSGEERVGGFVSWNLDDATLVYAEGSGTDDDVEALVGGSYTFSAGPTVTLEYFYNGFGSHDDDLLEIVLAGNLPGPRQLLFRKNYLMLQCYDQDTMGRWSGLLRWTVGLDDGSSNLLGLYEYNLSDHVQLFANGTLFNGDDEDEFGALLEYQAMAGVEFSF